jgi:hypothetical protein
VISRYWKLLIGALVVIFALGLAVLPSLLRSVRRGGVTEQQARREFAQAQVSTPADVREKAQLFWISTTSPLELEATTLELPLSSEPVQRSRQILTALISQLPSEAQRTLPADADLLSLYLLPDGSAIADFSEALGTKTPSGILSEQQAVDSMVRTLGANVPAVHSLKILIHGQEAETLAGHIDLTGFFPVPSPTDSAAPATPSDPASPPPPGAGATAPPTPAHP